jgi:hypothetical protein
MEKQTLNDFLKKTGSKMLAAAAKLPVRELDEEEPGRFVSFVDDGDESYDVHIGLGKKGEMEKFSCDCNKKAPCLHIIAVANAIQSPNKKEKKAAVKKTAKIPEALRLLEEVAPDELQTWVRTLLEKNKDLQLSFTHYFSKKDSYTPEELTANTKQAVTSIVKNKKKIDQTLLKKILTLWEDIHQPVIELYNKDVTNANSLALLHVIVQLCRHYKHYFNINTNKFDLYAAQCLGATVNTINNLQNEQAWQTVIAAYANHIRNNTENDNLPYINHIMSLLEISGLERKIFIFNSLSELAVKYRGNTSYWYFHFTRVFFDQAVKHEKFEEFHKLFIPYYSENEYNILLIGKLLEINKTALAEKHCLACIAANYRDEYNVPYWRLLKTAYQTDNNKDGVVEMARKLLPFDFGFEDYLLVMEYISDAAEKQKFRTKILTKAKQYDSRIAFEKKEFCFKLLEHEGKFTKMIELVQTHSTYGLIKAYFKQLVNTDKLKLLSAIVNKHREDNWYLLSDEDVEGETSEIAEILDMMLEHFDKKTIDVAMRKKLNDQWSYSNNKLVRYYESLYIKKE